MADNPNALGAPAEGFGQTVSFAFDPRGEVPQRKPITSQGPRLQAVNASNPQLGSTAVQPVRESPSAALLQRAAKGYLDQKLEEAQSLEFMRGMQRAMGGEALQEVKESEPWYARIFGDTPTVQGARAYTASSAANKMMAEQTANMKQLEALDPDAAAKHFAGMLEKNKTGDEQSDMMVMKTALEQMPSLLKAQAKAHYAYNQRNASKAMSDNISTGAKALQEFGEMFASDQLTQKDMDDRMHTFVMSVLPPDGIDEENYNKTLTTNMLQMAQQGQFHAIEALRKSGVGSALTVEQANRVEAATMSAATKNRDRYAFQYSRTIAEIKSDAANPPEGMKPSELSSRIDRANSAYQRLTGSPVGLFSSDQKADMLAQTFNAFKQEEERQIRRNEVLADKNATAGAKAAAAADTAQTVSSLVATGDWSLAKKLPGVSGDTVDLEVFKLARNNPEQATQFLRQGWAKGNVSTLIANEIQAPLKMGEAMFAQSPTSPPPDTFFQSVAAYRQMTMDGGAGFANAYFGEHAKSMAFANYMLGDNLLQNPNAPAIYSQAMKAKTFTGDKLPAKEVKALVGKVASTGSDWVSSATFGFAGNKLRDDTVRFIAEDVEDGVAQWRAIGMSDDEAVKLAINDSFGPDKKGGAKGEILGGFYIRRNPGASESTLSELMQGGNGKPFTAIPEDMRSDIFESFVHDSVKLPRDVGTTMLNRLPDAAGSPQFVLNAIDKDGKTIIRTFSGTQLQEYAATATKKRREQGHPLVHAITAPIRWKGGPDITYQPAEGAPSPYASASEWAAYRAKQNKSATSTK